MIVMLCYSEAGDENSVQDRYEPRTKEGDVFKRDVSIAEYEKDYDRGKELELRWFAKSLQTGWLLVVREVVRKMVFWDGREEVKY